LSIVQREFQKLRQTRCSDNDDVKKRGLIAVGVFVVAVVVFVWRSRTPVEPVYQGRAMTYWLKDLEQWNGDTNESAFIAFREMGSNAIPGLLRILQSGGPRWQRAIMRLNQKQSVVEFPFGRPWHETSAASLALYAMGTNASPALPALTNLLFHSNALISTTTALAGIGSEAVPTLLAALTNQNYRIRVSAASGLGWERDDLNKVVPALVSALDDPQPIVRYSAANSLGQMHAQPETTVPALVSAFSTKDALLQRLIVISLGGFGTNARVAIPLLLRALHGSDQNLSNNAAWALEQIDPDAAIKARLK
jgi:HEAT repeat protein